MIQVTNLYKSFGDLKVLEDISLHIKKGEIYGLIGRSGVGKSTLLRCINGLESYDAGSMLVDGREVKEMNQKELLAFRKNIGFIFQQFSLLNRMDVYSNVAFPMRSWKYDKKTIDRKVKELLELVGLSDKIHARPSELSGGQKQRVAIARALSLDPTILLCDEATSSLDPKTAYSFTDLLDKINKEMGITIVVVTHQMAILRRICQNITILQEGKVAVTGSVEDIFLKQHPALVELIGQQNIDLSQDGITIKVVISKENSQTPVLTQMVRDLNIDFVISGGAMEKFRDHTMGSILINLQEQDLVKATQYLDAKHIPWYRMSPHEAKAEEVSAC